jgi:hypothetical protein
MKKVLTLIAACALAPAIPAMASESCTDNCVKRATTDFSGKPPYKRSYEMVSEKQVREEKAAKSKKPKFLGTPPYKKRMRTIGR